MKFNTEYLINRLQEPSTWRGLVLIATAIGVKLEPEQFEAIITIGLAIVGAINVVKKDAKSPDAKPI